MAAVVWVMVTADVDLLAVCRSVVESDSIAVDARAADTLPDEVLHHQPRPGRTPAYTLSGYSEARRRARMARVRDQSDGAHGGEVESGNDERG
ncbi:MAG: hypothetical protein NTX53_08215 [candidate division WOR-3 bacterium]|nr:hypothetical protein [candidate division WOR-3 bacterium]